MDVRFRKGKAIMKKESNGKRITDLQVKIVSLERQRYAIAVEQENIREKLLVILAKDGILENDYLFYNLRGEYHQLHTAVEVMGRKYATNVMLINMGMSWECFTSALFEQKPDKKKIDERIAVLKADFERVREMFKHEYVKEIVPFSTL